MGGEKKNLEKKVLMSSSISKENSKKRQYLILVQVSLKVLLPLVSSSIMRRKNCYHLGPTCSKDGWCFITDKSLSIG